MEKFFIVKDGSALHRDYWAWKNNIVENNKIISDFLERHGIEATKYIDAKDRIGILPTDQDKKVFEKQFTQTLYGNGLRIFKKNSAVGRAWMKQAEGMTFLHKPFPTWYNHCLIGKSSSRLFDHNGILYCSIQAETVSVTADIFQEIKGSEFYKIMEEIEGDE